MAGFVIPNHRVSHWTTPNDEKTTDPECCRAKSYGDAWLHPFQVPRTLWSATPTIERQPPTHLCALSASRHVSKVLLRRVRLKCVVLVVVVVVKAKWGKHGPIRRLYKSSRVGVAVPLFRLLINLGAAHFQSRAWRNASVYIHRPVRANPPSSTTATLITTTTQHTQQWPELSKQLASPLVVSSSQPFLELHSMSSAGKAPRKQLAAKSAARKTAAVSGFC